MKQKGFTLEGFSLNLDPDRRVGFESRKAYARRVREGFWNKWIAGPKVLDIGFRGGVPDALPIVPGAIGIELGQGLFTEICIDYEVVMVAMNISQPVYDGFKLPFLNESIDMVHGSHVLEHVDQPEDFLREWFRCLRVGGTLILFVPHAYLYERRLTVPPSRWSGEHKRSYTPASLLALVEHALEPNTYRVRHLADVDDGYDYSLPLDVHPTGCLEIELVLEKITPPLWKIEP